MHQCLTKKLRRGAPIKESSFFPPFLFYSVRERNFELFANFFPRE